MSALILLSLSPESQKGFPKLGNLNMGQKISQGSFEVSDQSQEMETPRSPPGLPFPTVLPGKDASSFQVRRWADRRWETQGPHLPLRDR